MPPEERSYIRAMVRAFPRALFVFFVILAICIALHTGPLTFAIVAGAVMLFLFLWLPRAEAREMRAAQRRRQHRPDDSTE
jgi:membrane protein implicated in regulation of membrane protease activity